MPLRTVSDAIHVIINTNAGGVLPIAAAAPGQRTTLYRMLLMVGAATTITIQDTAGNPLSAPYPMVANGSITIDVNVNGDPWFQSAPNFGLQINSSAAGAQVSADVYYLQGP